MAAMLLKENNKSTRNFWIAGGAICILLITLMSHKITRPFTGLHSWGEASMAWRSRVYLKYDISYTKLLSTWAVGDPPAKEARHYLDHPQLGMLLRTADLLVFGINEWAQRAGGIIRAVICLILFLKILRGLTDDKTAILSGLIFAMFPLTGFFGPRDWTFPLSFVCFWYYLVVIGALDPGPEPKKRHLWCLALSLFFVLQMTWSGFFYALAIGVHYVFRCIRRRKFPNKVLLAILIIAPLSSLILNFAIMAAGHDWDFQKIVELYTWRAGKGEMEAFKWGKWFARVGEFAVMNFSWLVLILTTGYLTVGQLIIHKKRTSKKQTERPTVEVSRRFPQFWLFLMPGVFQLLLLRGTLWMHHYWERPFAPFVAISAALAIMLITDMLSRLNFLLAKVWLVIIIGLIGVFCVKGLLYYHSITHFSPERVRLYKMLNEHIPPDKMLLSHNNYKINQHETKGEFYRPEIAWYLDREIIQADTWEQIQKYAQTGKYDYYMIPDFRKLDHLISRLKQRYEFISIPGHPGGPKTAKMNSYIIFYVTKSSSNSK